MSTSFTIVDAFTYEMVLSLDVLTPAMKNRVLAQGNC
jgi:hypothetical protein